MMSSILKLRGIRSLYPISIYPHAGQIFSLHLTNSRSLCSCTSKFPAFFQEHKFSNGVSYLQRRQNSHIYSPEKSKTASRDPLEKQAALSSEPFLDGTSANYIEEMYEAYKKNPSSVHVVHSFIFSILVHQLINTIRIYLFLKFYSLISRGKYISSWSMRERSPAVLISGRLASSQRTGRWWWTAKSQAASSTAVRQSLHWTCMNSFVHIRCVTHYRTCSHIDS